MNGTVSRRAVLKGLAAAGLAGCGDEASRLSIPYADQPEGITPGVPAWYATAMEFQGYAQPVLAESHMGRPTKLEGNPDSPWARGATDAFTQAACAILYDPQRSLAIRPGDWAGFTRVVMGVPAGGLRILTGTVTSPTLARQLAALTEAGARWHVHEPVGRETMMRASRLAFGRVVDTHLLLESCRVVVVVDDDLLGPGPDQVRRVRGWAEARRHGQPRLMVAEPTLSTTGAVAQDRLAVAGRRLPLLVEAIAAELGLGARRPGLTEAEKDWASAAALALGVNPGRGVLTVGAPLPAESLALAHAVNQAVGNTGRTVVHTEPVAVVPRDGEDSFRALVEDMAAGSVEAVLILDGNPVYTAPADLDFRSALVRVPLKIHAGLFDDETAALCDWHVPLAHALEEWTDLRAPDGTATIVQPLIDPVFGARRRHEILAAVMGESGAEARRIVMDTWRPFLGEPFEPLWRRVLHEGVVPGTEAQVARVTASARRLASPIADADGLELVFRPDPTVWDGRYAPIAWLQELPKPLTKLTWDAVAAIAPMLAARLGIADGDVVEIAAAGRTITAPAWSLPGQAGDTVTLFLGYGRQRVALPGAGGYDAYRLRLADSPWVLGGAGLRRTGAHVELATTQPHRHLHGHEELLSPQPEPAEPPSLYPDWDYPRFAWGMVIDLDLCVGCNACVVACQAENNIPVVGKSEVARGREMHWLRVDVYHDDDGATHFAPIPCMHCEKAPCEMGCPVNATVHGPDGLNQMIYNRCIGTRTCSSYCPYKVRRFNFFDYAAIQPDTHRYLRNPDVTVRANGVMEKCTYCVQRIRRAQIEARAEERPVADGSFTTACAQACPSRAIVFGDLNDPRSRVAALRGDPRHFAMLAHLGTRPRTTYLARIRES
ncbi:MAG: 4Fe-4S dicluster domain-containing protein [Pseudomonadota bacterium]